MEKTFTYYFGGEYDYDEYNYTVRIEEIKNIIVDLAFEEYFTEKQRKSFSAEQVISIKEAIKDFCNDYDGIWDKLADKFDEELKDELKDEAYEKYKNGGC